ncbi:MAG: tetratricopeptide repeat protein [Deltaproteobacteria bacterium]|nr:MAG: tetratricopeptide repeat protein [Deltaproteobacteria bacterium]
MKALKRTSVSAVMVLFLGVGLCYAQNSAKQISDKGLEYAAEGRFTEAKEEFEKALKIDAFYEPARRSLKIIEDVISQKIKAETAFHLFKGAVYHNRGQLSKAIAEYNKAIEINPEYAPAYNNRGFAYIGKGQYDQAISDFNKAIEINPEFAMAYNNRGYAYGVKGQYDQAISDSNKAIELNPKLAMAYNNRGLAYLNKGQHEQAISDCSRALEVNPSNAMAYNIRAVAYFYKKEFDKSWDDVYEAQNLGYPVRPEFLKALREASGRER